MFRQTGLDTEAQALLRVLDSGDVHGLRTLSERAAGRALRSADDLAVLARHVVLVRELISTGYLQTSPRGDSISLSLSRRGQKAVQRGSSARRMMPLGWTLGASLLASGVMGCAPMPMTHPYQSRPLLMGEPMLTGLAQVRDPVSGSDYYAPCNPCSMPSPKTPVSEASEPETIQMAQVPESVSEPQKEPASNIKTSETVRVVPEDVPVPVSLARVDPAPVHTLLFGSASSALDAEALQLIEALLPQAQQAASIRIRGRTDATGQSAGNRALALARAWRVRQALVSRGIDARKLKVFYCTRCYVSGNDTEQGRQANRRVEIEFRMSAADRRR